MRVSFVDRVRSTGRIAVALALLGPLVSCGQEEAPSPPAAPAAPTAEPASTPESPPEVAEVAPSEPPLEFDFVFPGAELLPESAPPNPREFGKAFTTKEDANVVAAFYLEKLPEEGWKFEGDQDAGELRVQVFSKDDQKATLFHTRTEDGTQTMLLVSKGFF